MALEEMEEMTDVKLLDGAVGQFWKASFGCPRLALNLPTGPITVHKLIIPACSIWFKVWCLDSFCCTNGGSKLKKDQNAPMCFDILGCHKKKRKPADPDSDAPMLWSYARQLILMQMQMLTLVDTDADADVDVVQTLSLCLCSHLLLWPRRASGCSCDAALLDQCTGRQKAAEGDEVQALPPLPVLLPVAASPCVAACCSGWGFAGCSARLGRCRPSKPSASTCISASCSGKGAIQSFNLFNSKIECLIQETHHIHGWHHWQSWYVCLGI